MESNWQIWDTYAYCRLSNDMMYNCPLDPCTFPEQYWHSVTEKEQTVDSPSCASPQSTTTEDSLNYDELLDMESEFFGNQLWPPHFVRHEEQRPPMEVGNVELNTVQSSSVHFSLPRCMTRCRQLQVISHCNPVTF
jgi:hypothetical protein